MKALAAAAVSFLGLASTFAHASEVETIMGIKTDKTGIYFQVKSAGCTGKDDFRVGVEKDADVSVLTLKRLSPDNCELQAPYGAIVKFGYKDLGLKDGMKFRVSNDLDQEPRLVSKPAVD